MASNSTRVEELMSKLALNKDLRQKLAGSDEAGRNQILADLGYSDIPLSDIINYKPPAEIMITDEELAIVAGGGTETTTTTTAVTIAAASAVAT